ncbi:MAG: hypothetical protein IPK59_00695 [Rhodospirillaceae bacterium]|nr:hypothetical protein [Rhodospirillaceae bacterium]
MHKETDDLSRVTLSDRAYWNDDPQGFVVRLTGNVDVRAVFYVPLLPPNFGTFSKDIGGRLYLTLSGAERLLLGQNVNAAIRQRLPDGGPKLHLMGKLETQLLEEAQCRHVVLH